MKGREVYSIIPLMMFFSICGSVQGMCEETLAFYPIIIPLMLMAGFDKFTSILIVCIGAGIGVLGATLDPFAVSVAIKQYHDLGLDYVSMSDGLTPTDSLNEGFSFHALAPGEAYLLDISSFFLLASIIMALVNKVGHEGYIKNLTAGMSDFIGVAIVCATAAGVTVALESSNIQYLVTGGIKSIFEGLGNNYLRILVLFLMFVPLSLLIPSTSGFATLMFPLLVDTVKIDPEVLISGSILAFITANGLVNLCSPIAVSVVMPLQLINKGYYHMSSKENKKFDINSQKLELNEELNYGQQSRLREAYYSYQDFSANVSKYFRQHPLIGYSFKRVIYGLLTLLLTIVIVFLLVNLVTDEAQYLPSYFDKLGLDPGSPEYDLYLEDRMKLFGVYGPMFPRLLQYIVNLIPFVPKYTIISQEITIITKII
ncbi:hypothetical protein FQA39_LY13013 [Lamprigera yunnana]|nr:hypothetical protein FQA39_LY13013 [Lamprigera yunnana]